MNSRPSFPQIEHAFRDGRVRRVSPAEAEQLGAESAFREHCEARDPGVGAIHADGDCCVLSEVATLIAELVQTAELKFARLNVARDVTLSVPGIRFTQRSKFNAPMIAEMIAEAFEDGLCAHAGGVLVAQVRRAMS